MPDHLAARADASVLVTRACDNHRAFRSGICDRLNIGLIEGIVLRIGSIQVVAKRDVHDIDAIIGGIQDGPDDRRIIGDATVLSDLQ